MHRKPLVLISLTVAALTLSGCGGTSKSADASAQLACGHFRNVLTGIANRTLTNAEAGGEIHEVNSVASVSKSAGIPDSARSVFAAATAEGAEDLGFATDAFVSAASGLIDACKAVGV